MKSSRRLALRRETLTELNPDELSFGAAAADALPTLQAGCDANEYARDALRRLTLHWHCSWSCI